MTSRPLPAVVALPASDDEAYTKRIHAILNAAVDRLHRIKEIAIIFAGINQPHETETWDRMYGFCIETFNAEAELIGLSVRLCRVHAPYDGERPSARLFFVNIEPDHPNNLIVAMAQLAESLVTEPNTLRSLMLDFILARFVSDDEIEREATVRGGAWDKKLRFRKSVIEAKHQLAAARELEEHQERRRFADIPGLAAVLNEALKLKGEHQYAPLPPRPPRHRLPKSMPSRVTAEQRAVVAGGDIHRQQTKSRNRKGKRLFP